MKKQLIFLVCLFLLSSISAQVSVSARHRGNVKKISKTQIDKFKKTTTVFVLSNILDKEVYEKVLRDSWDVTPYKIVDLDSFNILNFNDNNYSFVMLEGYHIIQYKDKNAESANRGRHFINLYLDLFMLQNDDLISDLNDVNEKYEANSKSYRNEYFKAVNRDKVKLARFLLFPTDEFTFKMINSKDEDDDIDIIKTIYNDDVFYNYKPGFLKNYLQKINNKLIDEEEYWMYENDYTVEIKKLATNKLFIPNYHLIKFNHFKQKDKKNKEDFDKVFEDYDYEIEFQDQSIIDERILNEEEFYYLRYVRVNNQKFIHIINSKTGEIVYRNYVAGFLSSFNLKKRHIKDINTSIKKSLK